MNRFFVLRALGNSDEAQQCFDRGARILASVSSNTSKRCARDYGASRWISFGDVGVEYFDDVGVAVSVDGIPLARNGGRLDLRTVAVWYRDGTLAARLRETRGDFAGVCFDARSNSFSLFRDHFGARPLYFARTTQGIGAASHPGVLLSVPGVRRAVNRRFVACVAGSHYRTFDNDPTASPFRDISQVPAGSLVTVSDSVVQSERYWDLSSQGMAPDSEAVLAERYRELLLNAVRRRLEDPRPRAFTLSGGMDSSSVLACTVQLKGEKQDAFSTVYSDSTFDESAEIKAMLAPNVTQWHRVLVDNPPVFKLVGEMVRLHGEPVATATWLSHYILVQKVAQLGFGNLFGGLGGDELNAGEYEYFFSFFAELLQEGRTELLEGEIQYWMKYHDHPLYPKNRKVALDTVARVSKSGSKGICLPDLHRVRKYAHALSLGKEILENFIPEMDHPFSSYLNNRTYQDMFRETTPCCLRAQERHASAFGIDAVNPFLDVDLVEFMFRVPVTMKIRNGVTKHLLREAMSGILPEETRTRIKKVGWNAPAHLWFSGAHREELEDFVASSAFAQRGIYDLKAVRALIAEHDEIIQQRAVKENHMMFLWQMVNLELWFREYNLEW